MSFESQPNAVYPKEIFVADAELAAAEYELWQSADRVFDAVDVAIQGIPPIEVLEAVQYGFRLKPSGAAVGLCLFHDEKTPSFYAYPSGKCLCHGCGYEGTPTFLLFEQGLRPLGECATALGLHADLVAELERFAALRDQIARLKDTVFWPSIEPEDSFD